jgi:senataxin
MGYDKHLLEVQYRMHPYINKFPNANFYGNRISDGPSVKREDYTKSYLPGRIYGAYSFIHIENDMEMLDDLGQSSKNMVEVAIAANIIERLAKGNIKSFNFYISCWMNKLLLSCRRIKLITVCVKLS